MTRTDDEYQKGYEWAMSHPLVGPADEDGFDDEDPEEIEEPIENPEAELTRGLHHRRDRRRAVR
jgi:hypothetical protein